jgi:hypothetical protein
MRKTTTTWRRLRNGEWKQSITLTTPYPRPVLELLEKLTKTPATVATVATNKSRLL